MFKHEISDLIVAQALRSVKTEIGQVPKLDKAGKGSCVGAALLQAMRKPEA